MVNGLSTVRQRNDRGACCTLRWSEVDLARQIILRVPNKTARRKGVPVHIPIHPTLFEFLNQTPAGKRSGFVLPEFAGKYRYNDSDVAKEIRRFLIGCGIQVHKDKTGKRTGIRAVVEVGFHSLRHSFVSLCRQSNAPLAVVEAIVGHSNPAMTRHYTHVGDVAAGQAVAALPALGAAEARDRKSEVTGTAPLSERDQKLVAILGKMTAETLDADREAMLTVLLG